MADETRVKVQHFNLWALGTLVILVIALGVALIVVPLVRPGLIRRAATSQVDQLIEAGRPDLALRHLSQYLNRHPDDVDMLRKQARLTADQASTSGELLRAIRVHERLRLLDPEGPNADEVDRQLADLYIRYSDAYRARRAFFGITTLPSNQERYRAAIGLTDLLIEGHPNDAEPHRLQAMAYEGVSGTSQTDELIAAIDSYKAALEREPTDLVSAERLARLYRERLSDPGAAQEVLDRLLAARENDIDAHMARYRYYREARRNVDAGAELKAALELEPNNPTVRLAAAELALRRDDTTGARGHLEAAVAHSEQDESLSIRLMRGLIEFAEEQPQEAMDQWRQGLVLVGGTHAQLTWWLANVMIRTGRISEARPLVDQYRRLVGGNDDAALDFLQALIDEQIGRPAAAIKRLEQIRDQVDDENTREQVILTLGRCYEALGDKEQARQAYRLVAQIAPGSPLPRLALAQLTMRDRPAVAAATLESALAETGPDPGLLLALAQVRLNEQALQPPAQRSWTQIDRALSRAAEIVPDSPKLARLQAIRAELDGRIDQADTLLENAIQRTPGDISLWTARADLLSRATQPGEALELLDRARENVGDKALLRLTAARILVELGRGREAQNRLVDGIAELPSDEQAALYESLGRLRRTQGDINGARQAYRAWAAVVPESPAPRLALLEINLNNGQFEEAEAQLAELRPGLNGSESADDMTYLLAEANILFQSAGQDGRSEPTRLARADEAVDRLMVIAPELPQAYLLRARIKERQGLDDEAVVAYKAAWQRGDATALAPLVDLLARLGRYSELEQLRTSDADAGLDLISAQALLGAGDQDRAAELLEKMVDDPARIDARRARLLELAGRTDVVEAFLRRNAESANPPRLQLWLELVDFMKRNDRNQAEINQTIREALDQLSGEAPVTAEPLLLWVAGQPQAADEVAESVLEANKDDVQTLMEFVNYYRQTERLEFAEPLLENARKLAPSSSAIALELALVLSRRSATDPEAWQRVRELTGNLTNINDNPGHRLAYAIILLRSPDPDDRNQAIAALENLIADLPLNNPQAAEARRQLSKLMLQEDRPERAVAVIDVVTSANDLESLELVVTSLIQAGRLDEADRVLDRMDLLFPGSQQGASLRATLVLQKPNGFDALERAVDNRSGSPDAGLFARSACLQLVYFGGTSERFEVAARIAADLARREPARAWVEGLVLAVQGQSEEALDRCEAVIDIVDLNDDQERQGIADVIIKAINNAPPDRQSTLAQRGSTLFERLLERRPGDPGLLNLAARVEHQLGRYEQEVKLYRRALERQPSNAFASYNLALTLSGALDQQAEALELLEQLSARIGSTAAVLGAQGVVLLRMNRPDEAIDTLSKALELEPTAARHYYLALAYRDAGQDNQFREHLQQARSAGLEPESVDVWDRENVRKLLTL